MSVENEIRANANIQQMLSQLKEKLNATKMFSNNKIAKIQLYVDFSIDDGKFKKIKIWLKCNDFEGAIYSNGKIYIKNYAKPITIDSDSMNIFKSINTKSMDLFYRSAWATKESRELYEHQKKEDELKEETMNSFMFIN